MTKIQVLGTGCAKCKTLMENVIAALKDMGLTTDVEKVEDIQDIIGFGVMSTPALVINGEVKVSGRVPTVAELRDLLK